MIEYSLNNPGAGFIFGVCLAYATTVKVRVSERKSRRELNLALRELDKLKDAPIQVAP